MPARVILCVICGNRGRYGRSKLTKICTIEREEKIREGYRRRLNKELNSSVFNEQIHLSCYKSLVYDIGAVSINSGAGRPRRRKHYSKQVSHSNSSSNFTFKQLSFQSPCATSSPIHPRTTNTQTQSIFKTSLPITSTPRRAARFRKCYSKPKAHSQPATH